MIVAARNRAYGVRRRLVLLGGLLALSATAGGAELTREDIAWLNRVTFGVTSATLAEYRARGRRRFLERQLDDRGELPAAIAQQIAAMQISVRDGASLLKEAQDEKRRVRAMPEGESREAARNAFQERAKSIANEAARRASARQ